ncbi:hypothetical protein V496_00156 [Pseudogymnoascus sp. VKM F-4515 (FW-2607)]|nr:hypothetical protein V496_00156 [Pseudogymnoascus sp. VKM F-4515 (FW-2607)]
MSRGNLPQGKSEEELLLQVMTQNTDPVTQPMDIFKERNSQERNSHEQSFEAVQGRRLPWSETEDELLLQVVTQNKGTITGLASIFKEENHQERSLEAIRCRLKKTGSEEETPRTTEDETQKTTYTAKTTTPPAICHKDQNQYTNSSSHCQLSTT